MVSYEASNEVHKKIPESDNLQNEQHEWKIDTLPNRLTFFRIFLIPIILVSLALNLLDYPVLTKHHHFLGWLAGLTFCVASITDFLDGYIARKKNIITVFGSFLDPIADKFLVISSVIMLQALGRIPVIIVIILVLREVYMVSLRLLASERDLTIPVSILAKWKTAMQMVAIPLLMANDNLFGISFYWVGTTIIYLAAILSVYSASEYSLNLLRKLKKIKKLKKMKKKKGS